MPDPNPSSDWPFLDGLWQLWASIQGWVETHILQANVLWQLVSIVGALITARVVSHWIAPRTKRFVAARATDRQLLLTRLRPAAFPLLWALLLWFAVVALHEAQASAKLVEIALGLLVAWTGARLVTSFVASPFWSRLVPLGIVFVVALKAFDLWTATLTILENMVLTIGTVRVSALGIIEATLILVVFWAAAGIGARWLTLWADRLPGLSPSARVLLGKIGRALAWAVMLLVALHVVGINLTTLAVFSGAVGLGIGFGLQKVVSNLISGVILLLDRSVKPGDVIAVGEHFGWINALDARYVSVVTRDGIEHLIPNEDLISTRVENWSHTNNLVRLHAPIGVSYATDLDKAIELVEQSAAGVARVLAEPQPRCLILGFGDSSVDLELRFWINDPRSGIHNVRSDVLKRIWDAFHANGIELPFPQRDLHLKAGGTLPVQLVDKT
jgi:small-conductance mechanosensitive channel